MPDPYSRLSLAIMGESQGVGTGAAGFGGATAGLAAGAAAAGFGRVAGAVGLSGADFVSDETEPDSGEPEGVAFTPPALAGCSAAGFASPSGSGELGDLISSGIFAQAQTYGSVCIEKNVNFYQLESAKSTSVSATKSLSCALVPGKFQSDRGCAAHPPCDVRGW